MRSHLLLSLLVLLLAFPHATAAAGDLVLATPFTSIDAVPPKPVRSATLAVYNNSIFAFGGTPCYQCPGISSIVEYDPQRGDWEARNASLPEGLFAAAAATFGDRIYLFGGWKPSGYSRRILAYDPSNDSIEILEAQLPSTRHHLGAAVHGDAIYLFGGQGNYTLTCPERVCTDIVRFDPATGNLTTLPARLPIEAEALAVAGLGDAIAVFASHHESGVRALIFDPGVENFTLIGDPIAQSTSLDIAAASAGGHAVLFFQGSRFEPEWGYGGWCECLRAAWVDPANASLTPTVGWFEGDGGPYNGLMAVGAAASEGVVFVSTPTENGLISYAPSEDRLVSEFRPGAPTELRAVAAPTVEDYGPSNQTSVRIWWRPAESAIPIGRWELLDVSGGVANATVLDTPGTFQTRVAPNGTMNGTATLFALQERSLTLAVRGVNAAGEGEPSAPFEVVIPASLRTTAGPFFAPAPPQVWPGGGVLAIVCLVLIVLVLARRRLPMWTQTMTAWSHRADGVPAARVFAVAIAAALVLGLAASAVEDVVWRDAGRRVSERTAFCNELRDSELAAIQARYGDLVRYDPYSFGSECSIQASSYKSVWAAFAHATSATLFAPAFGLIAAALVLLLIVLTRPAQRASERLGRLDDWYAAGGLSGETRSRTAELVLAAQTARGPCHVSIAAGAAAISAVIPVTLFADGWGLFGALAFAGLAGAICVSEGLRAARVWPLARVKAESAWQEAIEEARSRTQATRSPAPSRFRTIRELGHGSSARVLLAHDTLLDRRVVLKQPIAPWLLHDEEARARFLREARLAARIHHPRVVAVHEVLPHEMPPILVMEYVPGGTVEDALSVQGRLSLGRAVSIARDALEGLEVVHAAGMVHCDVKPSNILLDENGRAKLGDFDITRAPADYAATAPLGARAGSVGTLATASPEQLRGDPVDVRADVYSMGAVLYRMLTGEHYLRFDGLSDFRVREVVQSVDPIVADDRIPPAVARVIARALSKRADERFRSAGDMARALDLSLAEDQQGAPHADDVA